MFGLIVRNSNRTEKENYWIIRRFLGFEIMECFAFKLQFFYPNKQFQTVPRPNRIWTDLFFDFEKKKMKNRILISFRVAHNSRGECEMKFVWNMKRCRRITWIDVIRLELRHYSVYFSPSIVSINVSKILRINCSKLDGRSAWFHAESSSILQRIFSQKFE